MTRLLLKVELVPHEEQRYETAGDWIFDDDGCICVTVSDTGHQLDALLIGIHEAVEAVLCRAHGVKEVDVTAFDVEFGKTHNLEEEEPGEDPGAPYRREHATADVVERIVALEAGVVWRKYDDRVNALFVKEK